MPYLLEPYNAYQKPPRKKHWMEIAEEEALFHKIVTEQQALLQSQNLALKSQAPQPASQQVQDASGPAINSGAGGLPNVQYFHPNTSVTFSAVPVTGVGPLTVQFTNLSSQDLLQYGNFTWVFGDGGTSTGVNPSYIYTNTGSYSVTLTGSSQYNSSTAGAVSASNYISVSVPALQSSFTFLTSSAVYPSSASFTNTTTYNGNGTLTYLWTLGTGSITSSSFNPNPQIYANAGAYTASLQVTESSYNIASVYTASWKIT
jgi:PKD repeat protein